MENINWVLLSPYLFLFGGTLLTVLIGLIRVETKRPAQISSIITLLLTLVSAKICIGQEGASFAAVGFFQNTFVINPLGMILVALLSGLALVLLIGGSRYLTQENLHYSEYYYLTLVMICGAVLLAGANDLFGTFIALETMSLPAYTLAGFRRNDPRSNESAIKYFFAGVVLAAFYLMGTALIFGQTGTVHFSTIYEWSKNSPPGVLFVLGHFMVLAAMFIKVAAAPFHFWKPDVYEGAPITVTAMLATIVFGGSFVALTRIAHLPDLLASDWSLHAAYLKKAFRFSAVVSLVLGSVIMITQKNLKRMLAYSSIVNTGYILLGVLASLGNPEKVHSVWIYLFGYTFTVTAAFMLLGATKVQADQKVELIDLTGLMKRNPYLAVLWSVVFISFAGLPFTSGFVSKYSVLFSAVESGELVYAVVAGICVIITGYAYLRPIALMTMREPDASAGKWESSWAMQLAQGVGVFLVLCMGLFPQCFIDVLKGVSIR